ncbi:hypothetical protein [Halobacteriovorax sp. YZS-1-1]|uniref:hypothetical protein n=1 Tax=unclassified Halobacteriovorax TaxID=2639665 RepID=UPI00399C2E37
MEKELNRALALIAFVTTVITIISFIYINGYTSEFSFTPRYDFNTAIVFTMKKKVFFFLSFIPLLFQLNQLRIDQVKKLRDYNKVNMSIFLFLIGLSIFLENYNGLITFILIYLIFRLYICHVENKRFSLDSVTSIISLIITIYLIGLHDYKFTTFPKVVNFVEKKKVEQILIWRHENKSFVTSCKNKGRVIEYEGDKKLFSYSYEFSKYNNPCK